MTGKSKPRLWDFSSNSPKTANRTAFLGRRDGRSIWTKSRYAALSQRPNPERNRRKTRGNSAWDPEILNLRLWLAEAVGFEPTVGFPLRSVSNRVLSASQPRFRRDLFSEAAGRGQEGKRWHQRDLAGVMSRACAALHPNPIGQISQQPGRPTRTATDSLTAVFGPGCTTGKTRESGRRARRAALCTHEPLKTVAGRSFRRKAWPQFRR